MLACEKCEITKVFPKKQGSWLAMIVSAYDLFVNEESGELDWMEETPY